MLTSWDRQTERQITTEYRQNVIDYFSVIDYDVYVFDLSIIERITTIP